MRLDTSTNACKNLLGAALLAGAVLAAAPSVAETDAQTYRLDGKITQAMAERVLSIEPQANLTIELNSPGGSLRTAREIARFVRRNGLSTHVRAGGRCAPAPASSSSRRGCAAAPERAPY